VARLSTASKVTSVLVLAIALVSTIGLVSYLSTDELVTSRNQVERTYESLMRFESVLAKLTDAEAAQRGYVVTGDSAYLAPYLLAGEQLDADLARLESLVNDAEQRARLELLRAQSQRRLVLMAQVVDARTRSGVGAATSMVEAGEGRHMMDAVRGTVSSLREREVALLDGRLASARRTARRTKAIAAAGGLLALLTVTTSGHFIRRDLRRRQRMEQAVRESEALLNQFLECLPAGAYVVDSAGRPRYANAQARAIFGGGILLDAAGAGLPHSHLVHHAPTGEPYRLTKLPIARALRGEAVRVDDIEIRREGDTIPLRVSAAPIFSSDGTVSFAIAVFSDISEEKRTEERLRRAKEAAEHANYTKSDFLARMSHELRTPLNSVIGFSNILEKNRHDTLTTQDLTYVARIGSNGRHLLALINDILDLSKIESGKVEIEVSAVDVGALVEEIVLQLRETHRSGNVEITAEVPAALDPLTADPGRLRQVLLNLVGNAAKFTAEGSVRVAIDVAGDGRTPARVRVIDTGIGVPADRHGAIFEAFVQADSGTARSFGGTGLGLPISHSLCALMGFRLTMTSEVGVGSEFVVDFAPDRAAAAAPAAARTVHVPTLPAGAAEASETGHAEATEAGGCDAGERRPVVLVVDDEADSRVLLTHHLEDVGCAVVTATCGDTALELARTIRPDLITLDLLMPAPDGWAVLARLRADPVLRDIPVIVVSVVAGEHRAGLDGAAGVLTKPFRRQELLAILRQHIPSVAGAGDAMEGAA
jgi:PAS domain S-box-containing protein